METSEIFDTLLEKLKVGEKADTIASRQDEITKALNKDFRSKDGCTDHKLMVGSFGRHTAIKSVSDLDMIFILPSGMPDTKAERWKTTKPREEIAATKECNDRTSKNMRHLARMARAWKNQNGVNIGGLLIDTLVHRFFTQTSDYDSAGTDSFDLMARDFFEFLKEEPDKDYYLALGSNQRVKVKARFQPKAKKAYNRCLEAIEDEGKSSANKKWREVFGTSVPLATSTSKASQSFRDTEQFIENAYVVDITESIAIDCEVTQDGWRPTKLREMLRTGAVLKADKSLTFRVTDCTVAKPYELKWKVLNRGPEAERRDMIRGQIVDSSRPGIRTEHSDFKGEHVVECYAIKGGVVVARDRIDVPISNTAMRPATVS